MEMKKFEGVTRISTSRGPEGIENARVQAEDDKVVVSWPGSRFQRSMHSPREARRLAQGGTTIPINQSLLWRMGFRRTSVPAASPGRAAGQ